MKSIYKELNNMPTIWKGNHRPFYKRLLYVLYKRFVDEVYLPKGVSVYVNRKPQTHKENYGRIASIKLTKDHNETCIFPDFNEIDESTVGIVYKTDK